MMGFSSTAIAPSGHIIPIGGTNLLVLQSLDGQGQVLQPSTVILQAAQTQVEPKEGKQVQIVSYMKFVHFKQCWPQSIALLL
jgi:hypothetical protein